MTPQRERMLRVQSVELGERTRSRLCRRCEDLCERRILPQHPQLECACPPGSTGTHARGVCWITHVIHALEELVRYSVGPMQP